MPGTENPLIVQSDRTLLLDVHAEGAEACAHALIPFAELIRSPEHLHTYSVTPLSLWNARSAGYTAEQAVETLKKYSRYDVPPVVTEWIRETAERFGRLRLVPAPSEDRPDGKVDCLYLVSSSAAVFREIEASPLAMKFLTPCMCDARYAGRLSDAEKEFCFKLLLTDRGTAKQNLLALGWPVKDEVPLRAGSPLELRLRDTLPDGSPFVVRDYQRAAADALLGDGGPGTGFGTIVLPCGAGKTIVGMDIMSRLSTNTLIVTTNITAAHQWITELLEKTTLTKDQIGEYTGESKSIRPVTIATYQILTWRPDKEGPYPHFELFRQNSWGLIIYDEVHMIPAPVFRVAAELQAVRRVGLTATLVREDGHEDYVFSLVGPKRYDVPWKELEAKKWIAEAECVEVRITLPEEREIAYAVAAPREKYRIASENPVKLRIVRELVEKFYDDRILIIGQFLSQLDEIARTLSAPIITGKTKVRDRDRLYSDFRAGRIRVLVVSKVANFAIDLPDASMAIQVSGSFGSRQEEAQRLGRILRPKVRTARFFTLITRGTVEEDFGGNRQKFLSEQGYSYRIIRYENKSSFDELS